MSKAKYVYRKLNTWEEIKITKKNIFKRLFCKHNYNYLIREKSDEIFCNPNGDEIEDICINCGKSQGTMFWEYEGMGYK